MVYQSGGNELLDQKKIFARLGVTTGARIADLGCGGLGHFIIPAAQLVGPDAPAYAVDIQKSVLDAVATRARSLSLNNVKTVWSNLENVGATNIPAASLDYALLINTLFWATDHQSMVTEAARLLTSGGKLVVIDWNEKQVSFSPAANRKVAAATVDQLATAAGLKKLDQFEAGVYHYGLIYQK